MRPPVLPERRSDGPALTRTFGPADLGCNNEVYAEGDFLELETLGPLRLLAPDETAEHTERWSLSPRTGAGTPTAEDAAEAAEAAAAVDPEADV